jgi:hypothetical protein
MDLFYILLLAALYGLSFALIPGCRRLMDPHWQDDATTLADLTDMRNRQAPLAPRHSGESTPQ